jgi:Tfp pilus assembly protein PilF
MLEYFNDAIDRNSFAHQEITEQIAQQAMSIARVQDVPVEFRQAFASTSQTQLDRLVAEKPGDARVHVFIASYYRSTGQVDRAAAEMAIAQELSPNKQTIINQQGFIELSREQFPAARAFFQTSFDLDQSNPEAREYLAAARLYDGDLAGATALIDSDETRRRFSQSEFLIGAARQVGAQALLIELFDERIELNPQDAQSWASLSFLYFAQGESDQAVETLNQAGALIPSFASTAACIADNIQSGAAEPQTGC